MLYGKKVSLKLKQKFCDTVMKSTMMYGSEYWTLNDEEEIKLKAIEMCMLTKDAWYDRIWNECITGSLTRNGHKEENKRE